MGFNKRRDLHEAMMDRKREARYIQNMTLGGICAAGVVNLSVYCENCTRRGRYRVTRLIDRHGAATGLPALKNILGADCRYRDAVLPRDRCLIYYPGLAPHDVRPL